jgi:hypothetical protein
MGGPYVVLSWPPADMDAAEFAARLLAGLRGSPGWREAAAEPGLRVWVPSARPPAASKLGGQRAGWLLGRIFGRPVRQETPIPPVQAARAIVAGAWGAYVALLPDPYGGPWWALRDPSGAVEAFTWRRQGVGVLASELDDLPPVLGPERLALDWDAVSDLIGRPTAAWGRCALDGVDALAPGDVAPIGRPSGAVAVWRPAEAARRAAPDALEAALVGTVSDACAAMASSSGGLLV